ncbi:unnamed protein product, partial [Linum tenue]
MISEGRFHLWTSWLDIARMLLANQMDLIVDYLSSITCWIQIDIPRSLTSSTVTMSGHNLQCTCSLR